MGYRLSRIYTRQGDDGSTGLGDGGRVEKTHPRIEAIGEVDELNSHLGVVLSDPTLPQALRELLTGVQHDLFDLGGELSIPGAELLPAGRVTELEQAMDALNAALPPLKEFILPGGSRPAALCHVARAACRRAERRLVALAGVEAVSPAARQYLNRLSDLLFVAAREINRRLGVTDVHWQPRRPAP